MMWSIERTYDQNAYYVQSQNALGNVVNEVRFEGLRAKQLAEEYVAYKTLREAQREA